jgi:hypothetical protein
VTPRRPARIVIGALIAVVSAVGVIGACGRIGFDPAGRRVADAASADDSMVPVDSTVDGTIDGTADGAIDAGLCDYLPSCMMGQITCCTATGSFCTIEGAGTCSGTIARCSIFTQQGCAPGWACCSTPQRPEPSCYDPLMPQPC